MDQFEPDNYKPLALLPVIPQIFERAMTTVSTEMMCNRVSRLFTRKLRGL